MSDCNTLMVDEVQKYEQLIGEATYEDAASILYYDILPTLLDAACYTRARNLIQLLFEPGSTSLRKTITYPLDTRIYNDLVSIHFFLGNTAESNRVLEALFRVLVREEDMRILPMLLTNAAINLDQLTARLSDALDVIVLAEQAALCSGHPIAKMNFYPQMMRLYAAIGAWDKAEATYQRFMTLFPAYKIALQEELADLQRKPESALDEKQRGRLDELAVTLTQLDNIEYGVYLGHLDMQVYRRQSVQPPPHDFKNIRNQRAALILLSEHALQNADLSKARALLEQALGVDEDEIDDTDEYAIKLSLSYVLAEQGETEKALPLITSVLDRDFARLYEPHQTFANAARTYLRLGQHASDPAEKQTLLEKANLYAERGYQYAWSSATHHWVYWLEIVEQVIVALEAEGVAVDKEQAQQIAVQQPTLHLPLDEIRVLIQQARDEGLCS